VKDIAIERGPDGDIRRIDAEGVSLISHVADGEVELTVHGRRFRLYVWTYRGDAAVAVEDWDESEDRA
jgi:hypothetical protein